MPIAFYGGAHDDFLFVREADALLHGGWLGPFDRLTLSKGPVFPLFLAGCARLGLSPQIGAELVLLAGGRVAAGVLAAFAGRRWIGTLAFGLVAADPAPLDLIATDLMREPLYAGLLLLVLGLAARTWLPGGPRPVAASALGLAFAAFFATRQEGVLLLPALALLAGFRLRALGREPAPWRTGLVAFGLPVLTAVLPLLLLAAIDARAYGVFRIDDMDAGPFPRAYGAFARIASDARVRYVPAPADARARAYRVSPAARSLAPYLEGEGLAYWSAPGCGENPIPGCAREIQAGWFMWALREAAVRAGHYRTARDADRFWRRVADEIDAACDRHAIPCGPRRATLRPPLDRASVGPILAETWRAAVATARLGPPHLGSYPSRPFAAADVYREVVRGAPPAPEGFEIRAVPPFRGVRRVATAALVAVMPVLSVVLWPAAILATLAAFASDLRARRLRPLTVLALAVLAALACRIAMLGVLSATAIRLQFRYVSPGFPLVLFDIAILCALLLPRAGCSAGRSRRQGCSTSRQVSSGSAAMPRSATATAAASPQAARCGATRSRTATWVM